jgi:hypothetical protein
MLIISPSFIMANIQEHSFDWMSDILLSNETPQMANLQLDYGFKEVMRSFLMNDLVNCPDPLLRNQYYAIIQKLSKKIKTEDLGRTKKVTH